MLNSSSTTLEDALTRLFHRHWLRVTEEQQRGVYSFPATSIDDVAQALFTNLRIGGIATLVVSGRRRWDPNSYYFESARLASKRGCSIVRLFLLPHRSLIGDPNLVQHWKLDSDAGIKTKFLYVGDVISSMPIGSSFGLDFGIWDDELVCTATGSRLSYDGEPVEWRVSTRKEDVDLARSLHDDLRGRAIEVSPPGQNSGRLDLEEPMVQTAPLMELLARAVCNGSYVAADDCSWYHSVWQYLRIFDMVSTPTWHPKLYSPQLVRLAEQCQDASLLISGTADYSVLAHILWAFGSRNRKCAVTVLDLCQTPLIICQWYARRMGHPITVVQDDILEYTPTQPFDAIVTDAFLTRFSPGERNRVVQCWNSMLKPGGVVITTARISEGSRGPVVASAEQAAQFGESALRRAQQWQDFIPVPAERIASMARQYAERMTSYPLSSPEAIRRAFQSHGFETEYFDLNRVKGEMVPTTYLELVARKLH